MRFSCDTRRVSVMSCTISGPVVEVCKQADETEFLTDVHFSLVGCGGRWDEFRMFLAR